MTCSTSGRNRLAQGLTLLAVLLLSAVEAAAVPAFARRYGLPCHYCHDGFPKLSPLGEQFRERGFRLEQPEAFKWKEWVKTVPGTLRGSVNVTFVEEGDAATNGIFKAISAGNLGARVSYWFDQTFILRGDGGAAFDRVGTDNAWARLELVPGKLYARGGRIELDLPFSQARSPHLLPYQIYFQNTGFETDSIALAQDGGEIGGFWGEDAHWSVAVVRGRNSRLAEDLSSSAGRFDGNVYGRIAWRPGQERVGALFYVGRNVLATVDRGRVLAWTDGLIRLGVDGETWIRRLNLYGLLLYGRNSNSFANSANPGGTHVARGYTGGFAQADYHLRDELVPTARLDFVAQPQGFAYGVVPGLEIWLHKQVKLSVEVGFYNRGRPVVGAFQVEVGL